MEYDIDSSSKEPAATGPVSGLFRSIAHLVANVIAIAQTRVELISTEIREEIHRVAEIMVWTAVALLAAGIGSFLLALVVIFLFWDTHRVLASVIVTAVFFMIAGVAGLVMRAKVRDKPRLLDATLTEFAKDRASLMSKR